VNLGATNTVVLLASSLLVVFATHASFHWGDFKGWLQQWFLSGLTVAG
jgi:heme/copper-type cytochrome/quinol oxidase subunit 3